MKIFLQRCCDFIVKYSFVFFLAFSNLSFASLAQPYSVIVNGGSICQTMTAPLVMGSDTAFVNEPCYIEAGRSYLPHSGMWASRTYITEDADPRVSSHVDYLDSGYVYIDASIALNEEAIPEFPALAVRKASKDVIGVRAYICTVVIDEAGNLYRVNPNTGDGCSNIPPVPPHPPAPSTCSISKGGVIDVDLGTMERSEIPTVQGGESESIIHKTIDINCEASYDVNVNMQINYTPITISATDVVKSSVPGLGVAVVYNNKALSPSDKTALALNPGSNSLDLAFQALRDPNVALENITTGGFTASAVLVMTEQ